MSSEDIQALRRSVRNLQRLLGGILAVAAVALLVSAADGEADEGGLAGTGLELRDAQGNVYLTISSADAAGPSLTLSSGTGEGRRTVSIHLAEGPRVCLASSTGVISLDAGYPNLKLTSADDSMEAVIGRPRKGVPGVLSIRDGSVQGGYRVIPGHAYGNPKLEPGEGPFKFFHVLFCRDGLGDWRFARAP